MNTNALAALEEAIEPYRLAGYTVVSQTDTSITLVGQPRPFSYFGFIIGLLLCWPAAVIYLVVYNRRRDTHVCLRITAGGWIEESGFTLARFNAQCRNVRRDRLLLTAGVALVVLIIVGLLIARAGAGRAEQ
jgi:hypothetical protein